MCRAKQAGRLLKMGLPKSVILFLQIAFLLLGMSLFVLSACLDWLPHAAPGFGLVQQLLAGGGVFIFFVGLIQSRLPIVLQKMSAALLVAFAALLLVEGAGHLLQIDYNNFRRSYQSTPIFYRLPMEPVCDVFYRRPGPQQWQGKVISSMLQKSNVAEVEAYADEKPITVRYDQFGFRNDDSLTDWDIVVVGDSFTELGCLADEDLFTNRLAELTKLRVKNLGCSGTGTFTHSCYLKEYGKSPATKHAMLIFYEGNDLDDIADEYRRLQDFRETGMRATRDHSMFRQSSLLKALAQIVTSHQKLVTVNAFYSFDGRKIPVTLSQAPPSDEEISLESKRVIESALVGWAETARSLDLTPWLFYMPCKRRVLHQFLEFSDRTEQSRWKPTNLPQQIQQICRSEGIEFVDITPAMLEKTRTGQLTFNTVWETHLNREGSQLVGELIAESFIQKENSLEQ